MWMTQEKWWVTKKSINLNSQYLVNGKQNRLQWIQLLPQDSLLDSINTSQATIILFISNHLINFPINTSKFHQVHKEGGKKRWNSNKRVGTCSLWTIEDALENWEIKRDWSSSHRCISSFTFLNFCWYFFTTASIFPSQIHHFEGERWVWGRGLSPSLGNRLK